MSQDKLILIAKSLLIGSAVVGYKIAVIKAYLKYLNEDKKEKMNK